MTTVAPGARSELDSEADSTPSPSHTAAVDGDTAGWDAILLAGFGGPEGPADVMPFLRNVTRGRGVPEERLAEVAHHYDALGGRSPINELTRELQAALQTELAARGITLPVLCGNRNWQPYLADVIVEAHRAGHTSLLALATSAYPSYSSCRQYREDLGGALDSTGLLGQVRIDKIRPYSQLPGFRQPFIDGLDRALDEAVAAGIAIADMRVVFTTHSIPMSMAGTAGAVGTTRPGAYVAAHLDACRAVADGSRHHPTWRLAYQSRSGAPHIAWLEPDINDVITELAGLGVRGVVVVPIGFISDHVEVIWDLDREARETAEELDLFFRRVATPGTDPRFVAGLADLVQDRLTRAAQPPDDRDLCGIGCCPNLRGAKPTTGGRDSGMDWAARHPDPALLSASGISTGDGCDGGLESSVGTGTGTTADTAVPPR